MITDARIAEDIQPAGLDWITALRAPAIRGLLDGGAFQMSLFDDRDMATITSPDFPGEGLILCRNAALAAERARKREDLLRATERDLAPIAAAVRRKREPLTGKAEIGLAVGAVIGKHKMAKHFALDITDTSFARKTAEIAEEAALDGLYAVRTSLPETALDDSKTVKSYKSLSLAEHAIRSIKTVDLHVRPVYHWLEDRVRAPVFLCMLAYYLEWHMRQRLAGPGDRSVTIRYALGLEGSGRMPNWFLSYHTPDRTLAERLKAAIERKDPASSVFFAPSSLRAGGAWTAQLAGELAEADAFILLVGEAGVGKWQVPEYDEADLPARRRPAREADRARTAVSAPAALDRHLRPAPGEGYRADLGRRSRRRRPPARAMALRFAIPRPRSDGGEGQRLFLRPESGNGRDARCARSARQAAGADRQFGRGQVLGGAGRRSRGLKRQAWPDGAQASRPWPAVFQNSRQWCFLRLKPGADPIKALVDCFLDAWQFEATDPKRVARQHDWVDELMHGKATLSDLIEATERRRVELGQPKPPAFLLYVDQGEELYARAAGPERRRFSEVLGEALANPRLRAMMSMRSDYYGSLQRDKPLFKARLQIDVPPLGEEELRAVVSQPPQLLGARFESEKLIDIIAQRAAEDSVEEVGALPYAPDGRRILSWSDDKTLRLWDAATGAAIGEPMRHEGPVGGRSIRRTGSASCHGLKTRH